jgi:hypothetical protein
MFGVFNSAFTANLLRFTEGAVLGVMVGTGVLALVRKGNQVAFGVVGVLFLGINVPLVVHHDLNPFGDAFRGLCSVDGFLLGALIYFAIALRASVRVTHKR